MTTETVADPQLTEESFEILRAAVNLARNEGTRTVAALRAKLHLRYPGREAQVQEALAYWAHYETSKGRHGD